MLSFSFLIPRRSLSTTFRSFKPTSSREYYKNNNVKRGVNRDEKTNLNRSGDSNSEWRRTGDSEKLNREENKYNNINSRNNEGNDYKRFNSNGEDRYYKGKENKKETSEFYKSKSRNDTINRGENEYISSDTYKKREYKTVGNKGDKKFNEKPIYQKYPSKVGEWLYGLNSVKNALMCNHRKVNRLFLLDENTRSLRKREIDFSELETIAKERGIPVMYQTKSILNQMCGGSNSQGIVMDVGHIDIPIIDHAPLVEESSRSPLILALDEVHDPHNFGAILRSCLLFGVDKIITCENNAAPYSPVSSVASAGSLEILAKEKRLFKSSHLHSFLLDCQSKGYLVLGTHTELSSISIEDIPANKPTVLVLGNEGNGLRTSIMKSCSMNVKIPMASDLLYKNDEINVSQERLNVDSLNVSVATGILLNKLMYKRILS